MAAPIQKIQVYGIQARRGQERVKRQHVVRWSIDGRQRSRSFRAKAEADRYRVELLKAVQAGDRFDALTGEPGSWRTPLADLGIHTWSRRWLAEQWTEWQPRTRVSAAEAMARFTSTALKDGAVAPEGLRRYLKRALMPQPDAGELDPALEQWLDRWCLTLAELDRETMSELARMLMLKLDGTLAAANTVNRYRTMVHACVLAAVDTGAIPVDPWPTRSISRARRKIARKRARTVDVRALPGPQTMRRAIDAIATRQAGSLVYQEMTAVAYYAGLRPSEVVMLRLRSLDLPPTAWGRIDVTEADISYDEPGEPKTGPRSVPIPPVLVQRLRSWIDQRSLTDPGALLFRTQNDTRPNFANWRRAWHRALNSIGHRPLRIYDCRHAAATTWLRAGVPLGETARRLGHSVETLVSTYVGALEDDEQIGNARIDAALATERSQ